MYNTLCWLLLWSTIVAAYGDAPSPSVDTSLSVVIHNDLNGPRSNPTGLIVTGPMFYNEAPQACSGIGESLADLQSFSSSFNLSTVLSHLWITPSPDEEQLFWVKSSTEDTEAVNMYGKTIPVNGRESLPIICTQSAPFSNATTADTNERWQHKVRVGNSTITGYRDRVSFRFLGIRYAEQPARFTNSQMYSNDADQLALAPGNACVQLPGIGSEDCLFLNIFTSYLPQTIDHSSKSSLRPVVLYIHGGAFIAGAGSDPDYDGGNLASRGDVVVVTINYRLGVFGFLVLDDGVTNGNYGIGDVVVALDWVRSNIANFGGDPDQITIMGQSAGALAVTTLLGSPQAIGKYVAALPMSNVDGPGLLGSYQIHQSLTEAAAKMVAWVLNPTNCTFSASERDCLTSMNAQELLLETSTILPPIVEDGVLVDTPYLILNSTGWAAPVPLLLGNLHDEAAALIPFPNTTNVTAAIEASGLNPQIYYDNTDLFELPSGPNATLNVFNLTTHLATDSGLRCLDQAIAFAAARNNISKSVWFYDYTRSYQPTDFEVNVPVCEAPVTPTHPYGDPTGTYFRCHGGDIYYVFGNMIRQGQPPRDSFDLPFSRLIVDHISSFVRSFDPNPSTAYLESRGYLETLNELQSSGPWLPVAQTGTPTLRQLDWPSSQQNFLDIMQCNALGLQSTYFL